MITLQTSVPGRQAPVDLCIAAATAAAVAAAAAAATAVTVGSEASQQQYVFSYKRVSALIHSRLADATLGVCRPKTLYF
jgi:hypothetical protein